MSGAELVVSFYGPLYDSVRVSPVAAPTTANWDHERKEWSRIHAQVKEQYQQYQLKLAKDQDQAKVLRQKQEAQEKARAANEKKRAEQTSSLARLKRLWWASILGLLMSGIIFVVLFTDLLRETLVIQLGIKTKHDLVPSLMVASEFSIIFWIAVAIDIVSRTMAGVTVGEVVTLSEALHKDDVAYWKRLYDYSTFGISVGAAMATVQLPLLFFLAIWGKCAGDPCLYLKLSTLAVFTWVLLACMTGAMFFESGYRAIKALRKMVWGMLMPKKRSQEVPKKSG